MIRAETSVFESNPAGGFTPCLPWRKAVEQLCADIALRTGPDRTTGWHISLGNVVDLVCLLARLLIALDRVALSSPPSRFRGTWRPCRAPCGEGVFVLDPEEGLVPRPLWRTGIDEWCAAVAGLVAPVQVRHIIYGDGRKLGIDIDSPSGISYFHVSVLPQGNPERVDAEDFPRQPWAHFRPGTEWEFWLANHTDSLCLTARLLALWNQEDVDFAVVAGSRIGPSIQASSYHLTRTRSCDYSGRLDSREDWRYANSVFFAESGNR